MLKKNLISFVLIYYFFTLPTVYLCPEMQERKLQKQPKPRYLYFQPNGKFLWEYESHRLGRVSLRGLENE